MGKRIPSATFGKHRLVSRDNDNGLYPNDSDISNGWRFTRLDPALSGAEGSGEPSEVITSASSMIVVLEIIFSVIGHEGNCGGHPLIDFWRRADADSQAAALH